MGKFSDFIKELNSGKGILAVLIDPDKYDPVLVQMIERCHVHCILVGGSGLRKNNFNATVNDIKKRTTKPVVIFPGDEQQISSKADGILFLSLVSGRNPEYLIGIQSKTAPIIRKKKLLHLPTAYVVINGGKVSATEKVTGTKGLPAKNNRLIVNTCLAAEMLGFMSVYLEAGSGAKNTVPVSAIKKVKKELSIPLMVGGGVDSVQKAKKILNAGADMLVVGNALEERKELLFELSKLFE